MMRLKEDEKFLFQEKTVLTLLFIYHKEVTYISEVSSNIESTFSHTNKIVKRLENLELLSSVFEGRSRFLQLTPQGYFFAQKLAEAVNIYRSDASFIYPEGYVPTRPKDKINATGSFSSIPSDLINPVDGFENSVNSNNSNNSDNPNNSDKSYSIESVSSAKPPEILTLSDRIQFFGARIKEVYDELIEAGADKESILRRLGPFDRELKIIGRELKKISKDDDSAAEMAAAYRAAEMQYLFYLGKE